MAPQAVCCVGPVKAGLPLIIGLDSGASGSRPVKYARRSAGYMASLVAEIRKKGMLERIGLDTF